MIKCGVDYFVDGPARSLSSLFGTWGPIAGEQLGELQQQLLAA